MSVKKTILRWIGAAVLAVLVTAALAPEAATAKITGTLSAGGYRVVALSAGGRTTIRATAGRRFSLTPPARLVTLHLLDRHGVYAGPIVVGRRGGRLVTGVRNGASLGAVRVLRSQGYARTERQLRRRWRVEARNARERGGVPIGAGVFGRVRSRPAGPPGAGLDQDRDGIPGLFDVDDDGDLRPDVSEQRGRRAAGRLAAATPELAAACPQLTCSGRLGAEVSNVDDVDVALAIAILAAILAAASLAWQIRSALGARRRRVLVEVRLGLPVYQQGGGQWALFIEVVNMTDHPVRWVAVSLETRDGRALYLMQYPPGGELPAVIQPHDSHHTWVGVSELERSGLDLRTPIAASVKLDSGEMVRSKARRLVSKSVAARIR
jgi:hypothetical protein